MAIVQFSARPELPSDIESERQVLGCIIATETAFDLVSFLKVEHFYFDAHREVYAAICRMIEAGKAVNVLSLAPFADAMETLKAHGGRAYIVSLAANVASLIDVGNYARAVYTAYTRREIVAAANDILAQSLIQEPGQTPESLLANAEARLGSIQGQHGSDHITPLVAGVRDAIRQFEAARKGERVGIPTGLQTLDKQFAGFLPGNLYILAGRPGMGKSALALSIGYNVAKMGMGVLFVSLEMSREQLGSRIVADITGIPHDTLARGHFREDQFEKVVSTELAVSALPFFTKDGGGRSISVIRSEARRYVKTQNIGLIIIDYLQLIEAASTYRGNKVAEISEISASLKAMAKDFKVPVLALSQLSRGVESRDDKRPMLSDLRESGAIEQDADAVMFVYREQYYLERAEPPPGGDIAGWQAQMAQVRNTCEVNIAKQRQGPVGRVNLFFDAAINRFRDLQQ